jgi:pentatricopeptide repeat protein
MPKAIKKRVTKKKGLKGDEVKGKIQEVLDVLKEKQNVMLIGFSSLGLAVILIVVFLFYVSSEKKKAYSFEIEAYDYYYVSSKSLTLSDEERWRKALELFQKSYEIKSTPSVLFYTGNCHFNLGDLDSAINTYESFINEYGTDGLVLPLVYQKLISAYFKKGETEKALKTINTFADFKNGIFRDTALILEARHYENSGDKGDALRKYNEIISRFPSSPWAAEAQARIKAEEDKKAQESQEEISEEILPPDPEGQSVEEDFKSPVR